VQCQGEHDKEDNDRLEDWDRKREKLDEQLRIYNKKRNIKWCDFFVVDKWNVKATVNSYTHKF
jgi:hypothetical protein